MKHILIFLFTCVCAYTYAQSFDVELTSRFQVKAVNPDTLLLLHHQVQVRINEFGVEVIPEIGDRDLSPRQVTGAAWVIRQGVYYAQVGEASLTYNPGVSQPYVEIATREMVVTYYAGLPRRLMLQEGPEN